MKILLILAAPLLALTLHAAPPPLTVAVFNFDSKDEIGRDVGANVASVISAALSAEGDLLMVERAELEKALGEQELGLSGTVAADTAARVGHLTGAKVLVTGRVFGVEKERIIVAKIIGTETSRVYGELSKAARAAGITEQATELAAKIAKTIAAKSKSLVAEVITREKRIERLRKQLSGRKLPVVSVQIPEQHFGQPVRDPAAQTELLLILQQCGFSIVDEKSKDRADIEITGEAFSALGLRKGNLISCKARVEIKAHDNNNRKLVVADRQTSVAVDLTEQTAAKTALQNAAMELAERLVANLAGK